MRAACDTSAVLSHRRGAVLAAVLVAGATVACGVVSKPAGPLVRRLSAAPRPAGVVELAQERRDGDLERGPAAALDLLVPAAPELACPDLLASYGRAGYALYSWAELPRPLPDPAGYCRDQLAHLAPGQERRDVTVIVYPPGVHSGHPSDGFAVTVTPARADDAYPAGSRLRLEAS